MPRLPIDYSRSLIYKLCCNDTDIKEEYVGSTTDFTKRKNQHKSICNNNYCEGYNYKVYKTIRDNGGFSNWSMIQIEKYPCESKRELQSRERYWIETLESKLNCHIPTRTNKEWREDNKDYLKEHSKEYRYNHKDYLKERSINYYSNNKDKIAIKDKNYRENNKEKIKEYRSKKVTCECGSTITILEKSSHLKSKKHLKYLENGIVILYSYIPTDKEKITCECGSEITQKSLSRHRKTQKHLKYLEQKK